MSSHSRVLLSMVVAVSAAGMMRNAQAAGQQGPPPVTITIDSDAEIYQEGSVASFTVTMTRRVGNQDRPVPMMRRYLAATFPDADTEVELVQLDATHWIFTPLLEGEGDQTLAVALHEDNARQVAAIEIIIGRLQDRNTVYQEILDADPPPLLRRLLEHLIALNTWLIERFEERVEELEEPLATASWVIAVDGTPPAITNVQPYAGQLLAEARPGITADLSDNISGVDPASAVVSVDYVVIPSVATEESLAAMPEEDLDDGQHILWITVADAVGNVGERFSVFTTDVTAPVIAGLSPADAAMVTTDKPTISAAYSDATAGIKLSAVKLTVAGQDVTAEAQVTDTGISYAPTEPLAHGEVSVLLEVKDKAGNGAQAAATFVVDSVPPVIADLSPETGTITNDPRPAFSGSFSDATTGVDAGAAILTLGTEDVTALAEVTADGFTYAPAEDIADGEHLLSVTVPDEAGNETTASVAITIDTTPPAMPVPAVITITTESVTLAGECEDDVVAVDATASEGVEVAERAIESWRVVFQKETAASFHCQIWLIDHAGNESPRYEADFEFEGALPEAPTVEVDVMDEDYKVLDGEWWTKEPEARVHGAVSPPDHVHYVTIEVAGPGEDDVSSHVAELDDTGSFLLPVAPFEGGNTITVTCVDDYDQAGESDPVSLNADRTPPQLAQTTFDFDGFEYWKWESFICKKNDSPTYQLSGSLTEDGCGLYVGADDEATGMKKSRIRVLNDEGNEIGQALYSLDAGGNFQPASMPVTVGPAVADEENPFTIVLTAMDRLGNEADAIEVPVLVDRSAARNCSVNYYENGMLIEAFGTGGRSDIISADCGGMQLGYGRFYGSAVAPQPSGNSVTVEDYAGNTRTFDFEAPFGSQVNPVGGAGGYRAVVFVDEWYLPYGSNTPVRAEWPWHLVTPIPDQENVFWDFASIPMEIIGPGGEGGVYVPMPIHLVWPVERYPGYRIEDPANIHFDARLVEAVPRSDEDEPRVRSLPWEDIPLDLSQGAPGYVYDGDLKVYPDAQAGLVHGVVGGSPTWFTANVVTGYRVRPSTVATGTTVEIVIEGPELYGLNADDISFNDAGLKVIEVVRPRDDIVDLADEVTVRVAVGPDEELGLPEPSLGLKSIELAGIGTLDEVLNVVKIEFYYSSNDEPVGDYATYDIDKQSTEELFSRESGYTGGKGGFGGPPADYGMDVFQDPFILENLQIVTVAGQPGTISVTLKGAVNDYDEECSLAEIRENCRTYHDVVDSLAITLVDLPTGNDNVVEAIRADVATTVFGVRGRHTLYETAADSNAFSSRHLDLEMALEGAGATATLTDNLGASFGPIALSQMQPDLYANVEGTFTISILRATDKGGEVADDLTARVTCVPLDVDSVLVDARETDVASLIFRTSALHNQGIPIKYPGATAGLGLFNQAWYAGMTPKPQADEDAVVVVLPPGRRNRPRTPQQNDARALAIANAPAGQKLKFMAADGNTNWYFRVVEDPTGQTPLSATYGTDAQGKGVVEIAGVDAGDYVYVATKGQENSKFVALRMLPYTKEEMEALIKGAIFAKLYETAVKPANLFGNIPYALPDQDQSNLMQTDLFQGYKNCDFDTERLCVTFGGKPYRETTKSFVLKYISTWAAAYEQPDGMGVRPLRTTGLTPSASRKGSTTLLYNERWQAGSGIASRLKSAGEIGELLVHEQVHVFHILKHPSMLDFEILVYAGPSSNWRKLRRAFLDNPMLIVPYMQNDPYDPLARRGLPHDPTLWTPEQKADFEEDIRKDIVDYAYRYLPTEVQAYNIQYRTELFFKRADVVEKMERQFESYWEAVFE